MLALYYVPNNALHRLIFKAWKGLYRSLDIDLHQVLISKKIFVPQRSQVSRTTTSNIANSADQDFSLVMMAFNAHCTVHSAPKYVNVIFSNDDTKSVQYHTGRAVASWFVTLIRMHMHAGSSPDWGIVRTGPLASLLTPSFFVLSRQYLKMRVLGVDVDT